MANQLLITTPDGKHTVQALSGDRLSLGRAGGNDLSYPEDAGLSRYHAVFEKRGGAWTIRDLGSKNGTLVNDESIPGRVFLKPGDHIRASNLTLAFDAAEDDALRATVVFDTAQLQAERPPAHTVTLGQLVGERTGAISREGTDGHWVDPVAALLRAGRELVARKPVEELFEDILDLSLESAGASRGVLLTREGEELTVKASRGGQFHISTAVRDRAINERTSLLIGDAMSDELLRGHRSIVMQKVHSLMAVPLQTDERVLGLIYVDSPHAGRRFNPSDLNLLTVMANVAAIRIERERLAAAERAHEFLERELEQAAEIQRQFLPSGPPAVRGLDLAGYNCPCHSVGGDYYDFALAPDGRVMLALGDVAGKGMSAALLMVHLQARMKLLSERPGSPAEMVGSLNRALKAVCPGNRFVTFFLCEIDPQDGGISFLQRGAQSAVRCPRQRRRRNARRRRSGAGHPARLNVPATGELARTR